MKKNPIISVIMPVYNAVNYIENAVNSVLTQSFKDFELFIIDDGSDDGSSELCDSLEKKDSRICVIHKKNGGVSSARNIGLQRAKGEYIAFIDNDDAYETMFLEKLYNLALSSKTDIVKCGRANITLNEYEKTESFGYSRVRETLILNNQSFRQKYCELKNTKLLLTAVWNGLYTRAFIEKNQLRFPEDVRHGNEDLIFNYQAFLCGASIAILPDVLYNHYLRKQYSTGAKYYGDFMESRLPAIQMELEFVKQNDDKNDLWKIKFFGFEECASYVRKLNDINEQINQLRKAENSIILSECPIRFFFQHLHVGSYQKFYWFLLYLHMYRLYFFVIKYRKAIRRRR